MPHWYNWEGRGLTLRICPWTGRVSRPAGMTPAADVIVSTANHEFFGIGMVEAAAAGAFPLVPRSLAYPEVFGDAEQDGKHSLFYDGTPEQLADRLAELAAACAEKDLWQDDPLRARRIVSKYEWDKFINEWDDEVEAMGGVGIE